MFIWFEKIRDKTIWTRASWSICRSRGKTWRTRSNWGKKKGKSTYSKNGVNWWRARANQIRVGANGEEPPSWPFFKGRRVHEKKRERQPGQRLWRITNGLAIGIKSIKSDIYVRGNPVQIVDHARIDAHLCLSLFLPWTKASEALFSVVLHPYRPKMTSVLRRAQLLLLLLLLLHKAVDISCHDGGGRGVKEVVIVHIHHSIQLTRPHDPSIGKWIPKGIQHPLNLFLSKLQISFLFWIRSGKFGMPGQEKKGNR